MSGKVSKSAKIDNKPNVDRYPGKSDDIMKYYPPINAVSSLITEDQ